jgi:PiT family inorganic phosphate transporter
MLSGLSVALILVVMLALLFDFINGFHDTANAIATSVSTEGSGPSNRCNDGGGFEFCWGAQRHRSS